jgi:phosphoglucosamine mutase
LKQAQSTHYKKQGTVSMTREFFGTDGIRGTVGKHPMTPDFMLQLANAVGHVLRRSGIAKPSVVVGKDTRESGYMMESALESGFIAAGCDVLLCGPLPTPGIAYLSRALRLDLGVVISASHNAYPDNGVKFFSADGSKLPDDWELAVETAVKQPFTTMPSGQLGKASRIDDAEGRYGEFCKQSFSANLSLKGMKLVVDCAHGAAYRVAPAVLRELGAEVIPIGDKPNGLNINDGVGATHPQAIIEAVKAHQAHYGIALDGDADRLQMVDGTGRLFNGDELLYLLAMHCTHVGRKPAGVVGTLMTNMAVELALQAQGIMLVRAKVGDRYVMEVLKEKGWDLGGEGSGHLLCLDKHTTGDGIISALQVLQAVQQSGQSLAQLLTAVTLFPQTLLNVKLAPGQDWKSHDKFTAEQVAVTAALGQEGRILIRASGTEPLLRVMVEARDASLAMQYAQRLAAAVQAV